MRELASELGAESILSPETINTINILMSHGFNEKAIATLINYPGLENVEQMNIFISYIDSSKLDKFTQKPIIEISIPREFPLDPSAIFRALQPHFQAMEEEYSVKGGKITIPRTLAQPINNPKPSALVDMTISVSSQVDHLLATSK